MNIDVTEIQKFNDLAHAWWDPAGSLHFLHRLNPLRLQWIERFTSLEKKDILDIGCGGGILSEALAQKGAFVTGIDLSEASLSIAKEHSEQMNLSIQYQKISAEELAQQKANAFDIVTCMEMLEHVPSPQSIVFAASKLVKPNGFIFFATLNKNLRSFLYAILGAEYVMNLLPKGTHLYERFLPPSQLARYIREAKLKTCNIVGIKSNLSATTFEFSDDVSINYMLACQRPS